jgi:hypothetical protein
MQAHKRFILSIPTRNISIKFGNNSSLNQIFFRLNNCWNLNKNDPKIRALLSTQRKSKGKRLFPPGHQVHEPHSHDHNKAKNKHTNFTLALILTHHPDQESG